MQGRGLDEDRESKLRGVQPRVFDHLFALTAERKKDSGIEYLVKCSYLEIYNEQIMDLVINSKLESLLALKLKQHASLNNAIFLFDQLSSTQSNLMVREDLKKGVYIEGLTEEVTKNSEDTIQLLLRGMRNRHVGAT